MPRPKQVVEKRLILGEGPGSIHEDDKIRIDIIEAWADIVCDLNEKLPPIHGQFDYIEAHHLMEHIESARQIEKIMQWCYDNLAPNGLLDICVPHKDCHSAYDCIQHVHFFNENSWVNYYSNPYAKEMNMPQFHCIVAEKRPHGCDSMEVHVTLQKKIDIV